MKPFRYVFIALLFALSGCGSSWSVTAIWGGTVHFTGSSCDIVQSDPPQIDPTRVYHYKVDLGTNQGDSVYVTDSSGRRYQGQMTSSNSFTASIEEYDWEEIQSGVPPIIAFQDISDVSARAIFYFTFNAPHGCTHTYEGEFEKGLEQD